MWNKASAVFLKVEMKGEKPANSSPALTNMSGGWEVLYIHGGEAKVIAGSGQQENQGSKKKKKENQDSIHKVQHSYFETETTGKELGRTEARIGINVHVPMLKHLKKCLCRKEVTVSLSRKLTGLLGHFPWLSSQSVSRRSHDGLPC